MSVWPLSISSGAPGPPAPASTPITLGRPGAASCKMTLKPRSRRKRAISAATAPSPAPPGTRLGFTESIATSRAVSSAASRVNAPSDSIPPIQS